MNLRKEQNDGLLHIVLLDHPIWIKVYIYMGEQMGLIVTRMTSTLITCCFQTILDN